MSKEIKEHKKRNKDDTHAHKGSVSIKNSVAFETETHYKREKLLFQIETILTCRLKAPLVT